MAFDPGQADLLAETRTALDGIALRVRGHRNIIMIKGHTALDDYPDSSTPQQKMDLSVRRAQVVADYLTTRGTEPGIPRVHGCSTYEPVVQRTYTPDVQKLNRRVEVEVTATLADELQGIPPSASADAPPAH
jgi:outer membrane protein OmpA-like peptidoglycan-associated protein